MKKRLRALHRNERGQIMIFGMLTILFVLVVGGLATDFAHLFVVDDELEKSMDAAALAGAGKLGFDDTAFPTVRAFAQEFAERNAYRAKGSVGEVRLDNDGNAGNAWQSWDSRPYSTPYGEVTLGVWDPTLPQGIGPNLRFAPSTDGTVVNAVMCRYKSQLPTTLFGIWGHRFFNMGAMSIATANPPATPPPDACLFPVGVGSCPFQAPDGSEGTSLGCGQPITFISSSGQGGSGCLAPPCTNTAAWVNLGGSETANAAYLKQVIDEAATGTCASSPLQTGDEIGTNNGMIQAVMDKLVTVFQAKYEASDPEDTIVDTDQQVTYRGKGWKVFIPVIETDCPAGAISGAREIIGWTEMMITQVINNGQCAVLNPWNRPNNPWDPVGLPDNCIGNEAPENAGSLRAIFGYYSCTIIPANPVPTPVPRSALATKLRLVR